jgi:hypothetical protein
MSAVPASVLRSVEASMGPDEIPAELHRYASIPKERRELLLHIDELLSSIAFGTVVIVVQDGVAIQIEASEKIRLS